MSSSDKIFKSKFPYNPPKLSANVGLFVLESFEVHHDKTLILDCFSEREWTGQQLKEATKRVASGLMSGICQVKKGDKILMMCPHSDHEIIFSLGAQLAGAVIVAVTPWAGYSEHKDICSFILPTIIVGSYKMHHEMIKLVEDMKSLRSESMSKDVVTRIIWIDTYDESIEDDRPIDDCNNNNNNNNSIDYVKIIEDDQVIVYYDDLLNYKYIDSDKIQDVLENQIDPTEDLSILVLTSGSSGKPKAVCQTHYNFLAEVHVLMTNTQRKSARTNEVIWWLDENSVVAGDLPMDHTVGQLTMFVSIYKGCKFAIMPSYDTHVFWRNVSKFKITDSNGSATLAHRLLMDFNSQLDGKEDENSLKNLDITSLRTLYFCGAPVGSIELCEQFMQDHPHLSILRGYGCTETGPAAMSAASDSRGHLNTVGHILPGITAKVVDPETGEVLGKNQLGELCLKGPGLANSEYYHGDNSNGQKTITKRTEQHDDLELYCKTGDQVYFDDEERLHVNGRYKDTLFLDEDFKILPQELEYIVEEHPLVEQCYIVGITNPKSPACHLPRAFVKLIQGTTGVYCTELKQPLAARDYDNLSCNHTKTETQHPIVVSDKDICKFVADRVPQYKHLSGGVRFVTEWPTVGALKKIHRNKLRMLP